MNEFLEDAAAFSLLAVRNQERTKIDVYYNPDR